MISSFPSGAPFLFFCALQPAFWRSYLWDQEVRQMHSVFLVFFQPLGQIGIYMEKRQKMRRRVNGGCGLSKNSQNGCLPLKLAGQRDCVNLSAGPGRGREILTRTSPERLTAITHSPCHPHAHPHKHTHSPTRTDTLSHWSM